MLFHTISATRVLSELSTDSARGLADEEAQKRLSQYGRNELAAADTVSAWKIFWSQFKNTLVIILLAAALLSGFLGHAVEAVAIAVIVLFAVLLGFFQEHRAEKALAALRLMAAPLAVVIRSGMEKEIPASELVPGDVALLVAGDRVPADLRLLEAVNLKIEEAALTGESVPVEKNSEFVAAEKAAVGDRLNMAYSGTTVTYGRGRAVVVATGMGTEFGRIAGMLKNVERTETPLQKSLDRMGKILSRAAFVVVAVIVALGLFRGEGLIEMIIFGVALAVAVVPEALPAVVTISLSVGVQRMAKRHALVRHLPAVETLGSVSVICSDKTGTLTRDEMTARQIYLPAGTILDVSGSGYDPVGQFMIDSRPIAVSEDLLLLLTAGTLCSDAHLAKIDGHWDLRGDPTEAALVVAAEKAGLQKELLDGAYRRIEEIPFSSETKRMTTLHDTPEGKVAYAKGAVEVILDSATHYRKDGKNHALTKEKRTEILAAVQSAGEKAMRVIGAGYLPTEKMNRAEKDLIFLGFFGLIDPPRPEAAAAILKCRQAGIRPIMITGDHPITARAIASELGLLPAGYEVVTGQEVSAMSDGELGERIDRIGVFARVSPEHKLRVVEALQSRGQIVAMTGDGGNDAPAMKRADIGVAMGIAGTDVTREAGAMILTDDNFASIVAAVEEGRIIFGNIKKYLMYLLSSNIGEIGLMAVASFLGLPLPLSAVQILYVNLATDGLPALALAVDPPEDDLMNRPPRASGNNIFSTAVVVLMSVGGVWSALANLGLFVWARSSGRSITEAMTMTFVSLVLIQFFKAYNFRSERLSVFRRPFANRWLNRAVLWELVLLALVIYLPVLHKPFSTVSLSAVDWIVIVAVAATVIPVLETAKLVLRKR